MIWSKFSSGPARQHHLALAIALTASLHIAALWALPQLLGTVAATPHKTGTSIRFSLISKVAPRNVSAQTQAPARPPSTPAVIGSQRPQSQPTIAYDKIAIRQQRLPKRAVQVQTLLSEQQSTEAFLAVANVSTDSANQPAEDRPMSVRPKPQTPSFIERAQPDYANNPAPAYPPLLREQGVGGVVWLRARVERDGSAGEIKLIKGSGYRLLDEAALSAVKRWRFIPAREGQEALATWVEFPIRFHLQG